MATDLTEPRQATTMADLLRRLGGISPRRVRLVPAPGSATEADVLALERRYNRLFELVDGILVEKAMGFRESFLACLLIRIIGNFAKRHKRGIVVGPDGMVRLSARSVRIPDVSFVSWKRLPGRRIPRKPIPNLAPDWAIEVLSKGNTDREMLIKRREYFAAGVLLVWEVDPMARTITAYTEPKNGRVYDASQTIDASIVLPGFTLALHELFEEFDESDESNNP